MGTSTSFRNPPTVKWNAARTAMTVPGVKPNRVLADLWNAAAEQGLDSSAVVAYLKTWLERGHTLKDRLAFASPVAVLRELVEEGRQASLARGYETVASIAERALQDVCRRAAVGDGSFISADRDEIRDGWRKLTRANPEELAHRYLVSFVEHSTRFFVSRDAPGVVGKGSLAERADVKVLAERLGSTAREIASRSEFREALRGVHRTPARGWARALRAVQQRLARLESSG